MTVYTLRGGPDIASIRVFDPQGNEVPILRPTKKTPLRIEESDGVLYASIRVPVNLRLAVRPRGDDAVIPRICPNCEGQFTPQHGGQVYCSRKCGAQYARRGLTKGPQNRIRKVLAQ